MGKHNKVRNVRNVTVSPRLPFTVQVRQLREHLETVSTQTGKIRRLLWLAVQKAGGRLEIDEADYRAAMDMPKEDSIVGVEHDKEKKKVVLVFQDIEGKRLQESDPPLVVLTDAPPKP